MSWFTTLPVVGDLIGKGLDKAFPDKAEARKQQSEINKAELEGAPASRLRLWRPFLGWVATLLFAWEVAVRPVIATYWPHVTLPPSVLEEVIKLLLFMLGGAF